MNLAKLTPFSKQTFLGGGYFGSLQKSSIEMAAEPHRPSANYQESFGINPFGAQIAIHTGQALNTAKIMTTMQDQIRRSKRENHGDLQGRSEKLHYYEAILG